jgi:uncharacterized protein YcbK (DUF882 family)
VKLSANFDSSEFACSCGCGYQTPDPALVVALQELRDSVACPVVILSGCRCAQHNAAVGGAVHSQHVLGKAADIRVPGMTARQVYAATHCIPGLHGFGVSDQGNFCHVDVRQEPARWCYLNGAEAPWHDQREVIA